MNEKYRYNLSPGVFAERLPWDKPAISLQVVLSNGVPNQAVTLRGLSQCSTSGAVVFPPQVHPAGVSQAQCDGSGTRRAMAGGLCHTAAKPHL